MGLRRVWCAGAWLVLAVLAVFALGSPAAAQSSTTELIMLDKPGCPWCVAWDREVGPAYEKSEEGRRAPLRRLDISEWRRSGVSFKSPLTVTPTFVLVADGREIGRITGYPGADFFWGLLDEMLGKLGPVREPAPPRDARRDDQPGAAEPGRLARPKADGPANG